MRNLLDIFNRKRDIHPVDFGPTGPTEAAHWEPTARTKPVFDAVLEEAGAATETLPQVDAANETAEAAAAETTEAMATATAESVAVEAPSDEVEVASTEPVADPDAAPATEPADGADPTGGTEPATEPVAELQEAFQRGHENAMAEIDAEIAAMRGSFATAIRDVQELSAQLSSRYCSDAVELASAIAKAVVGRELQLAPEIMVDIVRRALEEAPESCEIVIRCHPDDLATMQRQVPELTQGRGAPVSIRAATGEQVEKGGCIIQFEDGAVDAQPSISVDVIREAVEASLAGRNPIKRN
jgi:flagellar assembly protein FliH